MLGATVPNAFPCAIAIALARAIAISIAVISATTLEIEPTHMDLAGHVLVWAPC